MVGAVLSAVAAVWLAGCAGISDPYQPGRHPASIRAGRTTAAAGAGAGDPAPERGGTIPPTEQSTLSRLPAGAGEPTQLAALERYAQLSVNWQAASVVADQRRLAAISLGQARAQALQAAASAARDEQLTTSHVANSGELIAMSRGVGAAVGDWVVVTRETTTGTGDYAGLPPTVHVTYAQLVHTTSGWVVSRWNPQN